MRPARRRWLVALAGCAAPRAFAQDADRGRRLVEAALSQVGVTLHYDSSYRRLPYPGGDVPPEVGVCTDVIVRAYRRALGIDLQQRVHEDMRRAWTAYPKLWGLSRPDPNVDHRRVPNLEVFFRRHGQALVPARSPEAYQPGDLVTWRLSGGQPHIGMITDQRRDGRPLVVHNIGAGARVEDMLFAHRIVGHFRF
mgnify:CR=1 FL=1|jgi:uncharacterized protein YijF (DUF1287 family)